MIHKLLNTRWFKTVKTFVTGHKVVSGIALLVLIFAGYKSYSALTSTAGATRYVTSPVTRQTIVVSVSGSGQVSAQNQVDVKPKISGDVVYVAVKNGQAVGIGALLVQLDTSDAAQAVEDAQISLGQAKLTLEKIKGLTTTEGTIRGTKEKASEDLAKAYEDGFNAATNAFLDLPDVMSGLYNTLYGSTMGVSGQWNIDYYSNAILDALKTYTTEYYEAVRFHDSSATAYATAKAAYDRNFSDYKSTSRFSSTDTIESLVNQTYETTKLIAEAVKNANNLIQFYKDQLTSANVKPKTLADTYLLELSAYTGKTNSLLSNLLSVRNTIQSDKEGVVNAGFDVTDQEIKVRQAENALADAKKKLANCSIRAPFAGIVAAVNVKKGDPVSGSAVATIITKQRIAVITLNEVDAAKIKIGEQTTLTFDAVPDLSIAGTVDDVDTLGTVSQGVVTYAVKIGFDSQDNQVKPGMSVSAAIITDVRQDVLRVPASAIKFRGNTNYVQIFDTVPAGAETQGFTSQTPPADEEVQVGISNDTDSEIISGLKEGDHVVVRTVTDSTQTTQTNTAPSLFGSTGRAGGSAGGTFRALR